MNQTTKECCRKLLVFLMHTTATRWNGSLNDKNTVNILTNMFNNLTKHNNYKNIEEVERELILTFENFKQKYDSSNSVYQTADDMIHTIKAQIQSIKKITQRKQKKEILNNNNNNNNNSNNSNINTIMNIIDTQVTPVMASHFKTLKRKQTELLSNSIKPSVTEMYLTKKQLIPLTKREKYLLVQALLSLEPNYMGEVINILLKDGYYIKRNVKTLDDYFKMIKHTGNEEELVIDPDVLSIFTLRDLQDYIAKIKYKQREKLLKEEDDFEDDDNDYKQSQEKLKKKILSKSKEIKSHHESIGDKFNKLINNNNDNDEYIKELNYNKKLRDNIKAIQAKEKNIEHINKLKNKMILEQQNEIATTQIFNTINHIQATMMDHEDDEDEKISLLPTSKKKPKVTLLSNTEKQEIYDLLSSIKTKRQFTNKEQTHIATIITTFYSNINQSPPADENGDIEVEQMPDELLKSLHTYIQTLNISSSSSDDDDSSSDDSSSSSE